MTPGRARRVYRGAVLVSVGFWLNVLLHHLEIRAGAAPGNNRKAKP